MREDLRQQYLQAMGIQVWEPRGPGAAIHGHTEADAADLQSVASNNEASQMTPPARKDVSHLDWEALREQVSGCAACELSQSRTQTVFGTGAHDAEILFIGEAPGADEDRQGEPFVGRAGKLLNEMLFAIGFQREQVYIANILKCRPPGNRDPRPEEVVCCEPYLKRQIELLNPRLVVALGRIAAQNLLKVDTTLARLRGHCHTYPEGRVPVVVTYHPAYLLRSPLEKRKVWEDLQLIHRKLNELKEN